MKKSFYVIVISAAVVIGVPVLLVATLSTARRGEIRNLLKKGDLSFAKLRDLYNEIVRARDEQPLANTVKDLMKLAELREKQDTLQKQKDAIEKQIAEIKASLESEDVSAGEARTSSYEPGIGGELSNVPEGR